MYLYYLVLQTQNVVRLFLDIFSRHVCGFIAMYPIQLPDSIPVSRRLTAGLGMSPTELQQSPVTSLFGIIPRIRNWFL